MNGETFPASASDIAVDGVEYKAELSRSSSAFVYRGWQPAEKRAVAVKVLGLNQVPSGALDAATSLPEHPHIVRVHGAGVNAAGRAYLVMDYLDGGSMAERIERDGPMPWPEAVQAGATLALALEAAHQVRLLHLGIKPANVLLSAEGDVLLGDFVITELRRRSVAERPPVSFAYVAPEVLGGAKATRSSDIFSLGATVFAMITGHPPAQIGGGAVAELRRAQVPMAVAQALGQALVEEPEKRPASARTFARAQRDASIAVAEERAGTGGGDRAGTGTGTGVGSRGEGRPRLPDRRHQAQTDEAKTGRPNGPGLRALAGAAVLVVAAVVAYLALRASSPSETGPAEGPAAQVAEGGAVGAAALSDLAVLGIDGDVVAGAGVAIPGIQVRSVDPSSPAGATEVIAGDLITRIAGFNLASDATTDYEAIVGNRDPLGPLPIQVLRTGEGVVYAGELNGAALAPVIDRTPFADLPPSGGPPQTFNGILDETAALKVAAPSPWSEIDVQPFVDLGPNVQAAPDLSAFRGGWTSPGLNVTATTRRDVNDLEGIMESFVEPGGLADCITQGSLPYADGAFSGLIRYFTACGGTSSGFVQVVATPADQDFVLQLGVQLVDQDDLSALSAAVASVRVVGPL